MWSYLPYPVLHKVFQFLNYKDLVSVSEVCRSWYNASRHDILWKHIFFKTFLLKKSIPIIAGRTWFDEFRRLIHNVPVIQTETLYDHKHQVLHVSFSHNGEYFATCSKDGYVLLWNSSYPVSIKHSRNMNTFSWKYTQYSQFNKSDTLLLVSGVHFGTPHSTSGEIAVFNILGDFELQCRVVNKPYDIYGTWYNDQHLLSGNLHWLAHLVSSSSLWLNKASQEAESEHVPITHNMFRFYNRNASSIRAIMVANCLPRSELALIDETIDKEMEAETFGKEEFQHGNPVSYTNLKTLRFKQDSTTAGGAASDRLKQKQKKMELDNRIWYSADYRRVESELLGVVDCDSEDKADSDGPLKIDGELDCSDEDQELENDKYLIFTTGFKTYTPHQIGFKRIKPFTFPTRMDPGPSLKERLLLRERRKELLRSSSPPPEPNWLDFDSVADKFDTVDHVIDLHGHIVGMGLSPDHRYLYVNSRSWPEGYQISNPLDPPPIAQEIDIHVIDLVTLKQVDVCNEYVASGAEDKHGYLWDRHYGICLVKYPHADVVNSVAFNPKDPEMLVTTSDDHVIKIWRSRSKVRQLNLNVKSCPQSVELSHFEGNKKNFNRKCGNLQL